MPKIYAGKRYELTNGYITQPLERPVEAEPYLAGVECLVDRKIKRTWNVADDGLYWADDQPEFNIIREYNPRRMSQSYASTKVFMERITQATPGVPKMPSIEVRIARARMLMEEMFETIEKGLGLLVEDSPTKLILAPERFDFYDKGSTDLVELADGCADLKVVADGTLIACGIADLPITEAVNLNNLEKVGPGGYKNDQGKWIKPPGHTPPDIKSLLLEQGWDGKN